MHHQLYLSVDTVIPKPINKCMVKNYEEVKIPNIDRMISKFQEDFFEKQAEGILLIGRTGPAWKYITDFINSNPCEVWKDKKLKSAMFFFLKGKKHQGLHIDGFRLDRRKAADIALNVPIENCTDSRMVWYDGEYTAIENSKPPLNLATNGPRTKYLELSWKGDPMLLDHVVINCPMLVRINIPHQVVNNSENRRVMLSLRFTPDIEWLY